MNKYESIIILQPSLDEQGVKSLVKKFTDLIEKNGKVQEVQEMGKKKLAYEIQKQKEGHYILFNFDAEPSSIAELERNYKITDEVIKFIVVKKEK